MANGGWLGVFYTNDMKYSTIQLVGGHSILCLEGGECNFLHGIGFFKRQDYILDTLFEI